MIGQETTASFKRWLYNHFVGRIVWLIGFGLLAFIIVDGIVSFFYVPHQSIWMSLLAGLIGAGLGQWYDQCRDRFVKAERESK